MKTVNVTIQFEDEKLSALRKFLSKKGVNLEPELEDCLQKLYEKNVPVQVRDYIEDAPDVPTIAFAQKKPGVKRNTSKTENSPTSPAEAPVCHD